MYGWAVPIFFMKLKNIRIYIYIFINERLRFQSECQRIKESKFDFLKPNKLLNKLIVNTKLFNRFSS